MNTKIYVPDIECDSCVKVIEKRIKHAHGIHSYEMHPDSVDISYDESKIKEHELIKTIHDMGFRASTRPFERKSFSERWRDFRENGQKYSMVKKTFGYSLLIFTVLVLFQTLAVFGFLNSMIPGFLSKYGWWLLYLDISVATLGASIWYISSYKGTVTCMTGMMIGMTVAMQAGMMLGAVVGGTNGFFTGAMIGMTIGVVAGTLTGAVSGIMGATQGMMSGIMAGTMGAMITVMMFTDNVLIFMPYYMILNVLVLVGMIYLFHEEVVEGREVRKRHIDFMTLASACVIITAIITIIMVFGPKSPLFI